MNKTLLIFALILWISVTKLYAQTYIENQNSSTQTANFNISGVGKAGNLEITNGNLVISYPGDAGILKSTNNSRVLIGSSSSFTFTLGPYLTFEGIDYSGTGLGGNLRLNMPANKYYTLAYGGLTKFTFSDGKLRLGDANTPNLATIESFTPDIVPSTVGGTYESGLRVFNTGKVIDVGFSSTNSYGWIQSRNGSSYGINYELKLNPNGGLVSIGSGGLNVQGKLGIGTPAPTVPFEILVPSISGAEKALRISLSDASPDYLSIENSTGNDGMFGPMLVGHHQTDAIRPSLALLGRVEATNDLGTYPIMVFDSRLPNGKANTRPLFQWNSYGTIYMSMGADGSLGIGTTDTKGNKLAVAGNIIAEQVTVKLKSNWPDYVFTSNYILPSLQETEQHIKEKGHLPGIPSAEEVKNNGVDLGEMNAKLLQKIEELTLHLIELEKKVQNLQSENFNMKNKGNPKSN